VHTLTRYCFSYVGADLVLHTGTSTHWVTVDTG